MVDSQDRDVMNDDCVEIMGSAAVAGTSNDRSFGVSGNNDRNPEPTQNRTKGKRTRCRIDCCKKLPQPGCQKMCMRCFKDTGGVVGASSSVFEAFNDDADDARKRRRRERDGLEPVVVATAAAAATSSVVAQVLASTNADAVLEGAPEQVPPVPGSGVPLSIPAVTTSELNDGTEAKDTEKTIKCYGCKHSFPRKSMLKCSGCKIAMFCNEDCYKKNWPSHREGCKKVSSSTTTTATTVLDEGTTTMTASPLVVDHSGHHRANEKLEFVRARNRIYTRNSRKRTKARWTVLQAKAHALQLENEAFKAHQYWRRDRREHEEGAAAASAAVALAPNTAVDAAAASVAPIALGPSTYFFTEEEDRVLLKTFKEQDGNWDRIAVKMDSSRSINSLRSRLFRLNQKKNTETEIPRMQRTAVDAAAASVAPISLQAFIREQGELLREQKLQLQKQKLELQEQELQLQEQKLQLQEKSTATLASILATAAPVVPTDFLSSLSGIGDAVLLKLEEWSMQSKKIWSTRLQAHGAKTDDLEALFLPQIYTFCHNKEPIKVVLHSSFGPFGELEGMAFFEFFKVFLPQTSFVVVDQIPIAAPYNIGYLGQKNQAATILGVEDHLKIMNGLLNIFKGVNGTDAIIVGLGDAGRHSATLKDILDDSAVHPCNVYGSRFGMNQTFNSNFSYAQLYTKLYVGDLTEAQGRIAVKVLQLQGERLAYTKRPTNVAMIEEQQNAWNSVEPIIDKLRNLTAIQDEAPPGLLDEFGTKDAIVDGFKKRASTGTNLEALSKAVAKAEVLAEMIANSWPSVTAAATTDSVVTGDDAPAVATGTTNIALPLVEKFENIATNIATFLQYV